MKALVFRGPGVVVMEDRPTPEVGPGEVLLSVAAVGICGSEIEAYTGVTTRRQPPLVLGHEIVGTLPGHTCLYAVNPLTSCGECARCAAGQANLCRDRRLLSLHADGGQAEYVVVAKASLIPLPGLTDPAVGALVEPLAIAVNAMGSPPQTAGRKIAVLGCGALGLMAVRLASVWGAAKVVATDLIPARLDMAVGLGARPLSSVDADERFDLVVDMVGATATRQMAIALADGGATVKLVGLHSASSELELTDVVSRGVRLEGTYAYQPDQFELACRLALDPYMQLGELVTSVSLDQGPAIYETLARDPQAMVKVVLRP